MVIHGIAVDAQGRCAHWHSERDVVANTCGECSKLWACSLYHDELADHGFVPVDRQLPSVMHGAFCPSCGHPFNPGCKAHEDVYFRPVR